MVGFQRVTHDQAHRHACTVIKSRQALPYYKYVGDRTALAFGQPFSGTLFLYQLVRMLLGEKMRTQSDQLNN